MGITNLIARHGFHGGDYIVLVFNLSLTDDFPCLNKDLHTYIHTYIHTCNNIYVAVTF